MARRQISSGDVSAAVDTSTVHRIDLFISPIDGVQPSDEVHLVVNGYVVKRMTMHQAERMGLTPQPVAVY